MTKYRLPTLLFVLVLLTQIAFCQRFVLKGRVFDAANQVPIQNATVLVRVLDVTVKTDSLGEFRLTLGGKVLYGLVVTAEGYRTAYFPNVILMGDGNMDIPLKTLAQDLDEVTVRERKADQNVRDVRMGTIQLNIQQLKRIPVVLGEPDILKALTLQPGVGTVGEGAGGLNVRGGRTDQNLVLLDGAPLFNTSHLLGFFANVNPDVVQSVTLFKGGMPAMYGGRLSALLNMTTKTGNTEKLRVSGGIGPISSRLLLEGPILKNKITYALGARVAYPNWIIRRLPERYRNSEAFFYDFNGRVQYRINDRHSLALASYRSVDRFKFSVEDTAYNWVSQTASVQWNSLLSKKLSFSVNAIYSNFKSDINGQQRANEFRVRSDIMHRELRTDWLYNTQKIRFEAGANYILHQVQPGLQTPTSDSSNVIARSTQTEMAREWATYLQTEWTISDALTLQAGLRYVRYQNVGARTVSSYEPGVPRRPETETDARQFAQGQVIASYGGFEPRASLRLGLGQQSSVKLSYNRTRQFLHLISNTTAISPIDFWKLSDSYIPPQVADQIALGLFRNFKENTFETSIEVFYKDISNLVEYKDGASLLLNPRIETDLLPAKGKAYGFELSLQKTQGKLTGQIAYTYSRSLVQVQTPFASELINNGAWYPATFDRPHNLAVSLQQLVGTGVFLGFNFVYTTGRPATFPDGQYRLYNSIVPNYSLRNSDRIPDYIRADLSLSIDTRKVRTQKKYNVWNISLYNLLGRPNPYSIYFTRANTVLRSYRLSVFARIIPSLTYNFYF